MSLIDEIRKFDFTSEVEFLTSRSSGPGGQNVNKIESKVTVRFSIANSSFFKEIEKATLIVKLGKKLIDNDIIQIMCQETRSQLKNKELALKKLQETVANAFIVPKERLPASVPAKVKAERLVSKKIESLKKANRSKVNW
jgi:ribosome-associated protein